MNMNWLGDFGRGIGRGIKRIPGALNRLGEMAHPDDADPNLMVSPGWNPNHGPLPRRMPSPGMGGQIRIGRNENAMGAMAANVAQGSYEPSGTHASSGVQMPNRPPVIPNSDYDSTQTSALNGGQMPQRPVPIPSRMLRPGEDDGSQLSAPQSLIRRPGSGTPIPAATIMPPQQSEPWRAPMAPVEPRATMPGLNEGVNTPQPIMRAQPGPQDDVRRVPIPRLPGQKGDPYQTDDYGRARYEAQMDGRRDASGNISTQDAAGDFHTNKAQGIGWKGGLKNALYGMQAAKAANPNASLFEMAGGALGGGIRGKVDPDEGRGRIFDNGQGRQMQADQKRMDVRQQHEMAQEKMRLENERIGAQIDQYRGNTKDAETEQKYRMALANKANAEAQAKMTGRPQLTDDYDEATDSIRKIAVYPDGRVVVVGQSGAGQLRREGIESREGIASERNAAAMDRTKVQQEGAKERATIPRPGRGGAGASRTGGGDGIPTEARQEHTRVQGLKRKADAAWAKAKNPPQGGDAAALADVANAAMADYNANAEDFGRAYGDFYEVGPGEGGWAYIKPKVAAGGGQSGSRGPTAKLSDLTKYLQ